MDEFLAGLAGGLTGIVALAWLAAWLGGGDALGRFVGAAVVDGDAARLERLLDEGIDVDAASPHHRIYYPASSVGVNDWSERRPPDESVRLTPLMLAVYYDRMAMLDLLLAAGADVNAKAADGATALRLARSFSRRSAVQPLVDAGAEIKGVLPAADEASPAPRAKRPRRDVPRFLFRPSG